jgi:CspA family cold shock protein
MNLITKLSISLVVAAAATALTIVLFEIGPIAKQLLLLGIIFIATTATALLAGTGGVAIAPKAERVNIQRTTGATTRENGTVKWFNVSKGFGFIVKDDGEEIFVHFRSIRGEGRRGLRDGQAVSFVVAQSDKGPQAEDVVGDD